MVISYEIDETSLRRVSSYEMATSVRFCLLYDLLKCNYIALKMNNILRRKRTVDTDVVNDVMHTRQSIIARAAIRFL